MKRILLSALITLSSLGAFAQVQDKGGPISWKGKLSGHVMIPQHTMPGFDMEARRIEDSIRDQAKDSPWQFGYKYDTDITPNNTGIWTDLPNGNRLWRVAINCPGALTVNLLFEDFYMPEGAHLYLFDKNGTNRVGAYTSINNRPDGLLGSELVHGDDIIVEYYEPAQVQGQGDFTIANVVHGYRSLAPIQQELLKGLNDSGDCNIDVNCPLGNGWDDQIRSVAMIVVGGSGICTGALINNTCDDGTPYFLTANHCLGNTGNWAFRFNWESPPGTESCATTANSVNPGPPYDQTANGATILVSGNQADHALLQIDNMTLIDAQNWNLFYAGWNNDDTDGSITQATGIHHPSGDVKKICRENNSPYHQNTGGAAVWWISDWEEGVTEPGSSGSPLFDQNGRIIGQLYGGSAACSGTNDNGGVDYYGRLGVSWNLGIGNYLAPGSCGTATVNDGWDPNQPTLPDDGGILSIVNPDGLFCSDNFDPEVVLRNYGTNDLNSIDINYDIDGAGTQTFNWTGTLTPGSTVNVILPNTVTTGGAHVFNAYTTNPNGNADSDPSNDAASSNYTATIGGLPATVTIDTDCWGYEVYWEITDAGGSVVASGGNTALVLPGGDQSAQNGDPGSYASTTTINENLCLAAGCYDFTIYDDWGDGLDGTSSGCSVDGNYVVTDGAGTILIQMLDVAYGTSADPGNSEIQNFCLQNPCNSTFDYSTIQEQCNGDDDGSVTVNFLTGNSTGATYDIGFGPQATGTFTNLAQGGYNVSVTDGNGCTSIVPVTLGGPTSLSASASATDESCQGAGDGSISVTAQGGTPTYTYDFGSGAGTNSTATGLAVSSYTITVADANGCSITTSASVGSPAALGGSVTSISHETSGGDGAINITTTGGGSGITYSWTGPNGFTSSAEDLSGLSAGTYTVFITDDCGGQLTLEATVLDNTGFDKINGLEFIIFPNPSSGEITVQFIDFSITDYNITVSDVAGRIIYSATDSGSKHTLDLSHVADGAYMLRITSNELQTTKTIVVRK